MKVFAVSKFKGLLLAGSFTVLANYFVRLSHSIVAGNMLGADALAGINLVAPILAGVSFLSGLISTGMATCYSMEMGRCNGNRARQFFMQGLWTILLAGGVVSIAMLCGKDAFLTYLGASPSISAFAGDYISWCWAVVVPECVLGLMIMLGYADGDTRLCTLAYVANLVIGLAVSIMVIKGGMGTGGCALGSFVADLVGIGILSTHFFRKSNTFRPVRHFSFRDTWLIAKASFGDAAAFLCDGLLFLFVNKFTISHFGSSLLPVAGVVTAIWGLLEFFNGIGVAIQPIVTVYYGEGNTKSVRAVMHSAMKVSVIEGVVFMAAFGLFPELTTSVLGISDPVLVSESAVAIRCLCAAFVALALAGLFNSYYMFVDKPVLAGAITFLCYLIMPIACIACFSLFGVSGVWVGLGVGPFAGLAATSLVIILTAGMKAYPLFLPRDKEENIHVFNLRLTPEEIVNTSQLVSSVPGVPMRAALMVEEVFMAVMDRNSGKKLLGEATLDMNDGIKLTLRDDGEIFDITDADQRISSLRMFLVTSIMERQNSRINLVTTGFNRNVFRF